LFLGALRLGPERTRVPEGGTGTLATALGARLQVRTNRVLALEPLPEGRWRVVGEGCSAEADAVVVALPSRQAAALLAPVSPEAATLLEGIPRLDLRVWHSRHAPVPGWERGFGLLIHPPEGRGMLGAVAFAGDDPRGVSGLLQVRTYLGGAYPVAPELDAWPGVLGELRRWLPELPEAVQVREEACAGAFPLLEPGHSGRVARMLLALPPGLHWVGAARFGPGLAELAEGLEGWAASSRP
ncbi:MAG: FAD-dependent oxidoreductase, partial [Geothrix sp.]|uniref:FAD-dependent oxidoreductase n=1 Tax=Geothrix sp. TaxID=1962974 RepID=UPI003BB1CF02